MPLLINKYLYKLSTCIVFIMLFFIGLPSGHAQTEITGTLESAAPQGEVEAMGFYTKSFIYPFNFNFSFNKNTFSR